MEIYTLAQKPNFRESGVADFLFRRYDELIKCFQTASNILKVAINSESDFSLQTLQVIDDPVFIDLHKRSYFAVDDMVKMLHICGAKTVNALTAFLNFMKITPIVPTRCFSKENIVDILSHINKSDGHVRAAYAIKLYNKTDLTIEQIVLEAQQYSRPINLKRAQSLLDTDIKALKRHKSTPPTSTIESTSGEFEHELITFRV